MRISDVLAVLTIVGYATLFFSAVRSTRRTLSAGSLQTAPSLPSIQVPDPTLGVIGTWMVAVLHVGTLALQTFDAGQLVFGFAAAASATLWIAVVIYSIESMIEPIHSVRLILYPAAAVACAFTLMFHGRALISVGGPLFALHFVLALASYGVLLVAAIHAVISLAADRALHNHSARQGQPSLLVAYLPPLLSMERLLFRLILAGFVLLTLTLSSGILFHERIFGTPLGFDHKTVFSFVSWIIFAGLLYGRYRHGWRGRVALKYTLAGFAALLLAYIGTQFVLEVILRR
ncbi:cytochrome c biogenesis protein CcsA [soil metagenome]